MTIGTTAAWSDLLEMEQVVAREVLPAHEEVVKPLPDDLHPRLRERLAQTGITSLYSHQAAAYTAARQGNFAVVTGTASGKSLAFNLPVLQALASDPKARAIYLYPTKALAQDQARSLALLAAPGARPALYDGDTSPPDRRAARSHSNLFLTNPDMLHAGILPRHSAWADVLHNLEWVVVDEAHTYRGVFGAHVANVMARLRRLCRLYGADPRFAITSATIANPGEAAERLAGGPVTVVEGDGSPAAEREIAIWNPPLLDELLGVRASTLGEAATLLAGLVSRGVRTIVFAKSRAGCELVYRYAREGLERHDPAKARRLAAYRAGYTPEDRRRIERALADGELLGVVSTNALELGIDIGHLDCAVSVGFPGSTASLRQQWGRAGRRREGLGIFVAAEDALDQYFARHPDELLGRPVEAVVCNPQNPNVLSVHLLCAAAERPLVDADAEYFGDHALELAAGLKDLVRTHEGLAYRGSDHPSANVSLRSTGSAVALVEASSGAVLGQMDENRAHSSAHPGAVHLHQGAQFLVTDLDLDRGIAVVRPFNGAYYTQAKRLTSIGIIAERTVETRLGMRVVHGDIEMREQVVGYQRKRLTDHTAIDLIELELPQQQYSTEAIWFEPDVDPADDLLGTLHAAEHALISLLPLLAMCDRGDIGGLSTDLHFQTGVPTVFVYDGHPGGVGIAERGFDLFEEWVRRTATLLSECPCADGCPSCVQSPKCGNLNEPLSKNGARRLLARLAVTPS